jgi:hypothetical protein
MVLIEVDDEAAVAFPGGRCGKLCDDLLATRQPDPQLLC